MQYSIPFNKPYFTGNETKYIQEAVASDKISGNGLFTQKCHRFFEQQYGFGKCLLTSSCTDALEMAALLIDTRAGDEIIVPSFTFVSTANAFVLRGAKVVFADSTAAHPNVSAKQIEQCIGPKTKAIVVVHYAGMACNMDAILAIAKTHNLWVIEDAAHATDAFYKKQALGSFGHLATFSFHETKNIISGEGGMLVINDPTLKERAEILWEKGTNRAAFFRDEVDKYTWVDLGSSFLPSEITAAFLYAQIEMMPQIQQKRIELWNTYYKGLTELANQNCFLLPQIPKHAHQNGHLFYIICQSLQQRSQLISHLQHAGILAVFHYQALHLSPFYQTQLGEKKIPLLPYAAYYSDQLLRLPLYFDLISEQQAFIIEQIKLFFEKH